MFNEQSNVWYSDHPEITPCLQYPAELWIASVRVDVLESAIGHKRMRCLTSYADMELSQDDHYLKNAIFHGKSRF